MASLKALVLIGAVAVLVLSGPKKPAVPSVRVVQHIQAIAPLVEPPESTPVPCLPAWRPDLPCLPLSDIQKAMREHPDEIPGPVHNPRLETI